MRFPAVLCLVLFGVLARAQDVRPMSSTSIAASTYRQAEKEGRSWPNFREGDDGTIVQFSGDGDDADMIVVSTAEESRVLQAVQKAVAAAGLPKTDFLKRHGTVSASVDAEFNDYLVRKDRDTRFTFPIAKLLAGLKAAKLPQPIVVAVEKEGRSATLAGPKGQRELKESRTLFSLEELESYQTLAIHFHLEWWAPVAAWTFVAFVVTLLSLVPAISLLALRHKPFIGPPPPPPTPDEVQTAYDEAASQPWWKRAAGFSFLLVPLPIFLLTNKSVGVQMMSALPGWFESAVTSPFAVLAIFVAGAPGLLASTIRARRARQENPELAEAANSVSYMWPMFAGMLFMIALMFVVRMKPDALRFIPQPYIRPAIVTIPVLMGGLSVYLMWRAGQRVRQVLPADDPVAVAARELGERAGVRVRRVIERKEGGPNAFATLFGTVGITTKLREMMDEDEMRAVLAHEIGHVRASDPPRLFALSLGIFAVSLALWVGLRKWTSLGENVAFSVVGQMFFFVGLPFVSAWLLGPRRRRAEHAADLFALEQTGDVELVARALVKIHDANLAPHRLHPRDERLASHPALVKRLERLREAAGSTPNREGEVGK